jgi:hypothetical protein
MADSVWSWDGRGGHLLYILYSELVGKGKSEVTHALVVTTLEVSVSNLRH